MRSGRCREPKTSLTNTIDITGIKESVLNPVYRVVPTDTYTHVSCIIKKGSFELCIPEVYISYIPENLQRNNYVKISVLIHCYHYTKNIGETVLKK